MTDVNLIGSTSVSRDVRRSEPRVAEGVNRDDSHEIAFRGAAGSTQARVKATVRH